MKRPLFTAMLAAVCVGGLCSSAAAAPPKSAIVSFIADSTLGEPPLNVAFTDTSSTDGGSITAWSWDFGDGSPGSTEQNPAHTYTSPGSYTVTLTVTEGGTPYTRAEERYINVADDARAPGGSLDLSAAVVVQRPGALPKSEAKAAVVLVEEVQKRTGLAWVTTAAMPASGTVIALTSQPGSAAEGYHLFVQAGDPGPTVVWVVGQDPRGVLYGVGKLLRSVECGAGSVSLPQPLDVTTAPAYPLRGHQIGYRNTANTYDRWTVAQYEQYVRELVIFGANAVENVYFDSPSPHFPVPAAQMAQELSAICDDYGIQYWLWTPAGINLADPTARANLLAQHEALYQSCARIDAVFVPGGDPGSNPPELVLPFLHDLHDLLVAYHPDAGVWLSNQGFQQAANDYLFDYLQTQQPAWLAGMVYGPWTWMTVEQLRSRTPAQYPIRHYPDITHNVRCQFPVHEMDAAFAHVLNREACNPRPVAEAQIHNVCAPFTNGFVSYSDGAHDDVNKQIWAMRGWDPGVGVNAVLEDYARFFFGPATAVAARNAILGLENNWTGPLATNAGVDDTLAACTALETQHPELAGNWRWQFLTMRARYDRYLQERLAYEADLETQAKAALGNAASTGANAAMDAAEAILLQAATPSVRTDLRTSILDLCATMFDSIGYQSSVSSPYLASGLERSCVLDLIDWPVNNRYWFQWEFSVIRGMGTEQQKLAAIAGLLAWEDPGPGGFYDDLGNPGKQPHLVQQLPWADDPGYVLSTSNEFIWHNGQTTNPLQGAGRLSWQDQAQTLYGQPLQMRYTGLAADADYTVRAAYLGRFNATLRLEADGVVLGTSARPGTAPYQVQYTIPRSVTSDGELDLAWYLANTARGCQVAEVWLTTPDTDADGLPDYWENRYGLDSGSATGDNGPDGDPDNDGVSNLDEYEGDTDPTDGDSGPPLPVTGNCGTLLLPFAVAASVWARSILHRLPQRTS